MFLMDHSGSQIGFGRGKNVNIPSNGKNKAVSINTVWFDIYTLYTYAILLLLRIQGESREFYKCNNISFDSTLLFVFFFFL